MLEFNDIFDATHTSSAMEPVCLCRNTTRRRRGELVDHDYYQEYASLRGVDIALKKEALHEVVMPAGSGQPCTSFGQCTTTIPDPTFVCV